MNSTKRISARLIILCLPVIGLFNTTIHDASADVLLPGGGFESSDWQRSWNYVLHNNPYRDHKLELRTQSLPPFPTEGRTYLYMEATERDQGYGNDPYVSITSAFMLQNTTVRADLRVGHGYCDVSRACRAQVQLLDRSQAVRETIYDANNRSETRLPLEFSIGSDPRYIRFKVSADGYAYNLAQTWMAIDNVRTISAGPAAPTGLSATANSQSTITLRWTDRSNDEGGFRIERKIGTGAWTQIGQVGANVTIYSNTGLTAGTTYTYRVLAHNASGVSGYSNEASATTPGGTIGKPSAPTNLVARAASRNRVNLTWRDTSRNEQGFRIERKTGAGAWAHLTDVAANATSFANLRLTPNTSYTYRVRAFNAGGTSAWATTTAVKTPR